MTSLNRLLLIVDPQIDFITGSLSVPGAEQAMDALAGYIQEHGSEYAVCIITADWHPATHMSFNENGGIWPKHCVRFSQGAAIWPKVYDAALNNIAPTDVLVKGNDEATEEYSIFCNPKNTHIISDIIVSNGIKAIDVCGIAGDVCVSNTLEDGIREFGADMFRVLTPFCPSLDGGTHLQSLIKKYNLKTI